MDRLDKLNIKKLAALIAIGVAVGILAYVVFT